MCGIAGASRNILGDRPENDLQRMNDVMMHRGPDMGEIFQDGHFGLCHRRLSIIDLSTDGRQPMTSSDGRYTIVFNGEIYNFQEIRADLEAEGYRFRSRTDTEVLLALYQKEGVDSLRKIRGMFAYAIWDNLKKQLFAACDRIGKKPLYYYTDNDRFAFSSELKSILVLEQVPKRTDYTAIADYFRYLYIPHPKTIYQDICKLPPGHYLTFSQGRCNIREYWDVGFSDQSETPPQELTEELREVVDDAVRCRMVSDVPLGAFLSGGVDSSAIVALMARAADGPVTTCTIGFDDREHNEAEYARAFALRIGARHHERYIRDEPAGIVKKLVRHFDEPFADSSMVPTYYVAKVAREHVTVALSGDGGDESFAGYDKYGIDRYENIVRELVPRPLLRLLVSLSGAFSGQRTMKRLHSLCSSAGLDPAQAFYVTNSFITPEQERLIYSDEFLARTKGYDPSEHTQRYYQQADGPDHLSRILYTDLKLFLPGDILVKVDRMTMANSLEVRSPLLDHKVIEFAARIPSRLKLRGGDKKYILKEAFRELVGHEVLTRKKHGFTVPLNTWFRGELCKMAEETLFETEQMEQFFAVKGIRQLWDEHQHNRRDHGTLLWTLFIFALWLEQSPAGSIVPEREKYSALQ